MKTCKAKGCDNKFTPYYSLLQSYCSSACTYAEKKRKETQSQKQPKKRIAFRSDKRSKEERVYSAKRIVFLAKQENKFCPVYPKKRTTEVHHCKGRIGKLLLDERFWLAVSHDGHKYIELNPLEAKSKGWSLSRLSKTDV